MSTASKPTPEEILAFVDAAYKSDVRTVTSLLSTYGQNIVNERDANGFTALIWLAWNGLTDTVQLLLDNGADINAMTFKADTALILAARQAHLDIVNILLDKGADATVEDSIDYSALTWATRNELKSVEDAIVNHPERQRQKILDAATKEIDIFNTGLPQEVKTGARLILKRPVGKSSP